VNPQPPLAPQSFTSADRLLTALAFAGTFVLRWLTLDFENDYFMHMAWAAEMLRGQWPVRDFVEPGFPLQTLLAYVGLQAGGYQLSWEGCLACTLIAASTALTYVVCRRLGIPRWLSLAVVIIAAAIYPRLYTYPKAFVYPAAVYALQQYLRRPDWRSLLLVAGATAVAFLFRHDHGAWITPPTVMGLVLYHWREPKVLVRAIIGYGGVAVVLVSPWLVWVALSGHADQYWSFLLERSGGLTNRARLPDRRLDLDPSAPLITLAAVEHPRVGIRWAPTASAEQRLQREHDYGLEPVLDGSDEYRLRNLESANVRALVIDPLVEDTKGIDRGSFRVPDGGFSWLYLQAQRFIPLIRLRVLPGVVTQANAGPWLTYVTFLLPWIVLGAELARMRGRARQPSTDGPATALILPVAALSIITYQTLVRASPDSRLGDLAAITAILLAWIVWRGWHLRGWPGRIVKPVAVVMLALTFGSAFSYGRIATRVGVDGPTNLVRRLFGVGTLYGARPLDVYAPPGTAGLAGLARWLNECTDEADRLSVIGFEPQVFFLAERGFAAGLAFYDLAWSSSDSDQALAITRWSRQRVPVILAMESEWDSFSRDYPRVRAWIDEHYDVVTRSTFGGRKPLTVFVDRSFRLVRTHDPTQLPCFR